MRKKKYTEVVAILKDQIAHEYLSPGAALPSENDLARFYAVSRPTLRKGLAALEAEGLIYRRPGIGSFICDRRKPSAPQIRIGLSNCDFNETYNGPIMAGAKRACASCGAQLVVAEPKDFSDGNGAKPDALLLVNGNDYVPFDVKTLIASGIPLLYFNRPSPHPAISSIRVDYTAEAARGMQLLHRFGAKRTAAIVSAHLFHHPFVEKTRFQGYCDGCAALGMEPRRFELAGKDRVARLRNFIIDNRIDSLFALTGSTMDPIMSALRQLHWRVGQEVQLLCFDRLPETLQRNAGVIRMEMPLDAMAERAVNLLAERIHHPELPVADELFRVDFAFNSLLLELQIGRR